MKHFEPECWYKAVCDDNKEGCQDKCVKYLKMRYLMQESNLPVNKCKPLPLYPERCDVEAFRKLAEIKDNIEDFVENGRSLYITSPYVGNGKTTWAIKLLLKFFENVWVDSGFECRGVFVHVPTFLMMCKDFKTVDEDFEQLKRNILDVDIVIWDDIACTDISAYDLGQLSMYIEARHFKGLSNIFTGNLNERALLEDAVGTRLTSRIWNSSTEIIELRGGDRR